MKEAWIDRSIELLTNCWKTVDINDYKPKSHNNNSGDDPSNLLSYEISSFGTGSSKTITK